MLRFMVALASLPYLPSCKTVQSTQSNLTSIAPLDSQSSRDEFIRTARIWDKPEQPISRVDFSKMDPSCNDINISAPVSCTFVPPERDGGRAGWTPKFKCKLPNGTTVAIKYGSTNAEVFHEVFTARLLQALGFHADCDYPIRELECRNCPADPFAYSTAYRQGKENRSEQMATQKIEAAMAEVHFSRNYVIAKIDNKKQEGWGFDEILGELKSTDPEQQLAREALSLLMAVVQHSDNRLDNQSLYCIKTLDGNQCAPNDRYLIVGDVGSTLGAFKMGKTTGDGGFDVPPSLSHFFWDHAPIWNNWAGAKSSNCTIQVIAFDTISPATLKTKQISEEGRKFLAHMLDQLTDAQLRDLVEFSRLGYRKAEANITSQMWDAITKMQSWAAPFRIIPFTPINSRPVSNDLWTSTLRKMINKVLESPCS